MATVSVDLGGVGSEWAKPCKDAAAHLNALFKRNGIKVELAVGGDSGPVITVTNDSSIQGDAVHGRTSAEQTSKGKLVRADVRLPVSVSINTPQGIRRAGAGVYEVIAAHEFVHALGHAPHDSDLMGQTMVKAMGNSAGGDKLQSGSVKMPPLKLSSQTTKGLKAIWS
jgi:hypothetical protein